MKKFLNKICLYFVFGLFPLFSVLLNASTFTITDFDETDATHILDAAFKAPSDTIIVPNNGKDWIVQPIKIEADNKVIIFENGCVISAKAGAFDKYDKLISIIRRKNLTLIGYGATLRMQKDEYSRGEWRHCLALFGCQNINVYGFEIRDSGGDGIDLTVRNEPTYNKNIHIRDCIFENNRRQGISIISAENVLIENCIIKNTNGTKPESGIDLEPNKPEQRLVNIVFRNIESFNNQGFGYLMWLTHLDEQSLPVSVRFENCYSSGNRNGGVRIRNVNYSNTQGKIEFVDCVIENNARHAFEIGNKSSGGVNLIIKNCLIRNSKGIPFEIEPGNTSRPGGLEFSNTYIEDKSNRPFLYSKGNIFDVTGDVIVNNSHGARYKLGPFSKNITLEINTNTNIYVAKPDMKPNGGFFTHPILVTLTSETDSVQIFYTVDGSEPEKNSKRYLGPITVSQNVLIKARAFKGDYQSGIMRATFTVSR